MIKKYKIFAVLIFLFAVAPVYSCEDSGADAINIADIFLPAPANENTDGGTEDTYIKENEEAADMPAVTERKRAEKIEYDKIGANELRGVWIATVANINFPSKPGLSAEQMKTELDEIVKTCKQANLNAIFFQARPASDALYNSAVFPVSKYLAENQGEALPDGFDPLEYIIKAAHENNIELHAWVNPYRITYGTKDRPEQDLDALAKSNPAREHPEWVVSYPDGKLYYNPAIPEVRRLIADGVMEIVKNYDVDGIHFDDYFYPYPVSGAEFDDSEAYAKYNDNNYGLADFRRDNVNKAIQEVYNEIKKFDPDIKFGISPFGIWANNSTTPGGSNTAGFESYHSLYCDAAAWAEGGYIDYLCPQIYWSFATEVAPFDVLVRWWSTLLDGTDVDLYIGHGVYRINDFQSELEIPRQVEYARSYISVKGSVFYGYAELAANSYKVRDKLKELFEKPRPVTKPVTTGAGVVIGRPKDGVNFYEGAVNIMGGSDPAFPVYYKTTKMTRTKSGYFSAFAGLENGQNNLVFTQNGISFTHVINKVAAPVIKPREDEEIEETIYSDDEITACEIVKDYTYIKTAPDSSFYDDYLPASVGMRDNIIGFIDGYYKLGFGGYVAEDEVALTPEKPVLPNKILSAVMENKGNVTELKFEVTENVPVNAKCKDGVFNVTLYNTPDEYRELELRGNPLFNKAASGQNEESRSVTYTLDLIHPDNFYGFELVYENGFIIINVKNPMKKPAGDKPLGGLRIIVDAGHGGTEPGALGFLGVNGKIEKDFNLEIALALKPKLTALGATVIMIRETDATVDIYSRMDTLNEINPDLCVSVHHNSLDDTTDNSRTRGILVLYCNDSGRLLARTCSDAMSAGLNRVQRDVRYQSLAMLRNHKFSAALVEMLFLTNPDEYETACDPVTIQRSADAIAAGVAAWVEAQAKFAN